MTRRESAQRAARARWEAYWERMYDLELENKLGKKGREYIDKKYGEIYEPERRDLEDWDDLSEYDFDAQYP